MAPSEEKEGHYRVPRDEAEMQRLDDMHKVVKGYLGNKNITAPIQDPRSILEIGGGSGIWAIEVAQAYPKAHVTVVDIGQVPVERLPSNCTFQQLNVTKEFPFAPASMDVIHTRFVIMHLPHAEEVVHNLIAALKPGGYLLLEETVSSPTAADGSSVPPASQAFFDFWEGLMIQGGADPGTAAKLEGILNTSRAFSRVENVKFMVPFTPWSEDPKLNELGQGVKRAIIKGVSTVFKQLNDPHATALLEGWLKEVDDPNHKVGFPAYFIWAQKKV